MKILFNHPIPFSLAHGGLQIQIQQTKAALERLGVEVECQNWWDESQTGDIIHFFGRPFPGIIELAHARGYKFLFTDLLTAQGSRSPFQRQIHHLALWAAEKILSPSLAANLSSTVYQAADACVALTTWEASLMRDIYHAPAHKMHIIPNGVEQVFFDSTPAERGKWLVCTATITQRKRVVELARAAVEAKTPVWIIGKPYNEGDPYHQEFLGLARHNPAFVRYDGGIDDRAALAKIYREARGFVLLSAMESLSLSALEAAACECPLLLSDLPWARRTFSDQAAYCPLSGSVVETARILGEFYAAAPQRPIPPKPKTWIAVAEELKSLYEALCKTSR